MKTYISLIALAAALTGCGLLTRPVVTQQPVVTPASTNSVLSTNFPPPRVDLAITNGLITYITNTPPPQVIRQVIVLPAQTNYMTVTNYIPNPAIEQFVPVAKEINSSLNPTPTAPLINLGLAGLTGLAGILAAWQNRKAQKANSVNETIIGAIEKLAPEVANVVKPAVQAAGIKDGNADDIHVAVQKNT